MGKIATYVARFARRGLIQAVMHHFNTQISLPYYRYIIRQSMCASQQIISLLFLRLLCETCQMYCLVRLRLEHASFTLTHDLHYLAIFVLTITNQCIDYRITVFVVLLNQAHASHWLACAWYLEITSVPPKCVCVCVCVCVNPRGHN